MPIFTGRLPRIYSRVWIAKKWESGRKLADRNFSKNRDGARRRWRCSICSRRSPRITGISCKEVLFHPSTISRTVPGYVPRIKINSRVYVCVCVAPLGYDRYIRSQNYSWYITRDILLPQHLGYLEKPRILEKRSGKPGDRNYRFRYRYFHFLFKFARNFFSFGGGGKKINKRKRGNRIDPSLRSIPRLERDKNASGKGQTFH